MGHTLVLWSGATRAHLLVTLARAFREVTPAVEPGGAVSPAPPPLAGKVVLVVNVASGIALVGAPFYATYAAVKAGLARFGEALRRELKGEGIHVLTAYPGGTDTPMMKSNRAGPELGFSREPASAVADAIVAGIEANAFEVIRGGEARAQMIALNRNDPVAVDARFLTLKSALEEAVKDHSAL